MKLDTATALVTGANRGIGIEIVRALIAAGTPKVYAAARDAASLSATLAIDPARVVPVALDVTDGPAAAALARSLGDVTLLVNNAGVLDFGDFTETDDAVYARNFATNFHGPLNTMRAFAPVIVANGGGTIVNLLTVVALASMPGLAAYNASKAAALSLTQSARGTLAGQGIRVIAVFPGPVDTDMAAAITLPKTSPADVARAIVEGIEADREDIFPDPMAVQVYAAWSADHKAVEHQFAAM